MFKKKWALSLLLTALLIGGVFLYLNLGDIAKSLTEKIATNALGVTVRISSLDIALQDKKVTVSGLRISNPPGYKNAHAMTAKNITIKLNTASGELVDFEDIRVSGTVINLEVTEKGNNLSDLKKLAGGKSQKESVGSKQVRVIIKKMVIGASTLNPSITLLGDSLGAIKIPAVSLSGIGQGQNGITAEKAIAKILTKYISVAEGRAGRAGLFAPVKGVINVVEGAGGKALDVVEGAGEKFKGLGKNIGGLLGN